MRNFDFADADGPSGGVRERVPLEERLLARASSSGRISSARGSGHVAVRRAIDARRKLARRVSGGA